MRAMARSSTSGANVPSSGSVAQQEDAKSQVLAAIGELVNEGKAEWSRGESGEIELRLVSGEVFVLGEVAVTRVG
ncbi:hypothetical protein [Mesorhizobium opportunistum]|uniref:Uncharacterized protein n=1 Tax=Mesorhizobium opportunistum (strain LMG 24607 / HAMBI 3007 / WSM2075) TaxID=536019 RepID=F7YBL5_MESOW|nr:hypothetical protein [Mesorhizobium opportunistum]AEH87762.1 conserved hypothetical protein [Mesorhizobium opportunistum WSM2075]